MISPKAPREWRYRVGEALPTVAPFDWWSNLPQGQNGAARATHTTTAAATRLEGWEYSNVNIDIRELNRIKQKERGYKSRHFIVYTSKISSLLTVVYTLSLRGATYIFWGSGAKVSVTQSPLKKKKKSPA